MSEFPSNSQNPLGDKGQEQIPDKVIERVVTSEVVVRKPPLRRKFKALFFGGDAKSATSYIFLDVLIPALKNMIVDAGTKGIERVIYGEASPRRTRYPTESRTRVSYNTPVVRYQERPYMMPDQPPRYSQKRQEFGDIVLPTRGEVELILDQMRNVVEKYQAVTIADLHEMLGLPSTHVDNKWGWMNSIRFAQIRQVREGFLLELPPVELVE